MLAMVLLSGAQLELSGEMSLVINMVERPVQVVLSPLLYFGWITATWQ